MEISGHDGSVLSGNQQPRHRRNPQGGPEALCRRRGVPTRSGEGAGLRPYVDRVAARAQPPVQDHRLPPHTSPLSGSGSGPRHVARPSSGRSGRSSPSWRRRPGLCRTRLSSYRINRAAGVREDEGDAVLSVRRPRRSGSAPSPTRCSPGRPRPSCDNLNKFLVKWTKSALRSMVWPSFCCTRSMNNAP